MRSMKYHQNKVRFKKKKKVALSFSSCWLNLNIFLQNAQKHSSATFKRKIRLKIVLCFLGAWKKIFLFFTLQKKNALDQKQHSENCLTHLFKPDSLSKSPGSWKASYLQLNLQGFGFTRHSADRHSQIVGFVFNKTASLIKWPFIHVFFGQLNIHWFSKVLSWQAKYQIHMKGTVVTVLKRLKHPEIHSN